jgi:nucleotide-binding universal stress UspA family protein
MNQPVILVPLDGSEAALAALPIAKVLAEVEQATLRLVHIAGSQPLEPELLSRLRLAGPELDGATIDTFTGQPAAEILNIAKEIKPLVIVMCNHSSTEPRKVLGRTATEVLRRTSCPLVLVPPDRGLTPWHLHHVLVPHDGTPSTSAALRPAGQIAEHAGAELLVVHVTGLGTSSAEPGSLTTPRYVDQPQHEWPAWSNEFVYRLACMSPLGHLHVRMFLAHGTPDAEINRLAEEQSTDLMVVAWRGVWEDPRAPILKNLLGEACCPIMVLRTTDIGRLPSEDAPDLDAQRVNNAG